VTLQPVFKPWPPKYICSIHWHYSPQSSLDLPNISVPSSDSTAHNQTLASQIYLIHPVTLQPIIKPWPPKYICSIHWHYSPQSSLDLRNISVPSSDTTAHNQALTSPAHQLIHTKFHNNTNSVAVHFYSCVYKVSLCITAVWHVLTETGFVYDIAFMPRNMIERMPCVYGISFCSLSVPWSVSQKQQHHSQSLSFFSCLMQSFVSFGSITVLLSWKCRYLCICNVNVHR